MSVSEATVQKSDISLPEANGTIDTYPGRRWGRRLLAFAGPGYMVSVGYMDPGNWGAGLAAGSQFGFALLWVILISNLMAMFLQTLCVRLGLATGKDLAQACRDYYKRPVAIVLWLLCEVAIIACDLAEVIGSAIALKLLFGIPLVWGVVITALDVLLLLTLTRFGFRKLEAIVCVMVATVAGCFLLQVLQASPNWGHVASGLFTPSMPDANAFYISLGILGATVMPHNLYLHSSLVQTRKFERTKEGLRSAMRFATADVVLALAAAFFVNAAILILAGSVFHGGPVVEEFEQAHLLLKPALGGAAATAFAVALLASGQSATVTGTLAGQIVMEGFLRLRVAPWLRRMITRSLAVIPAIFLVSSKNTLDLLVLSQVVLSMQLSFAIFPLLMFTSDRNRMGEFASPMWMKIVGWAICLAVAGLNAGLLVERLGWAWFGLIVSSMGLFALWVKFGYQRGLAFEPS